MKEYFTKQEQEEKVSEERYYARAISHLDSLDVNSFSKDGKRVQELDDLVQVIDEISDVVAHNLI